MADPDGLRARLGEPRPILLDGPTGTELQRRGVDTDTPLWSATALRRHPEVLEAIHHDYAAAGAELHTANTFRTNPSTLRAAGLAEKDAPDMVRIAVDTARRAIRRADEAMARPAWVLGSLAPVADCYRPDAVPDQEQVEAEHAVHARLIAEAGADGLLVETMNTLREARAAVRAARGTGLPVLASFVVGADARLLSGEALAEAVADVVVEGAEVVLVNCASLGNTGRAVEVLAGKATVPFGAYANVGTADPASGWETGRDVRIPEYAAAAAAWRAAGARIIGSCCGTTPAYTAALRALLDGKEE